MRFRETVAGDLESIRARSKEPYDKLDGPTVAEESMTAVDDEGTPRLVMKAERVAEIYMAVDHGWNTPAMRWAMIEQAYQDMREKLEVKGYVVAYCFFPDGVPNGYIRRLVALGAQRMMDRCIRFVAGR